MQSRPSKLSTWSLLISSVFVYFSGIRLKYANCEEFEEIQCTTLKKELKSFRYPYISYIVGGMNKINFSNEADNNSIKKDIIC